MIATLQGFLAPYYLYIKLVHLIAVTIWLWSTIVGYSYFLVPVFKAWRRNPRDPDIVALRNWAIERFDHGVIYEHVAFPVVILSGPLLWITGGWNLGTGWFLLKMLIIVGIFIPMEICDYYLSHFGGSKRALRESGDAARYERGIHIHWWFFMLTTAPVLVFGLLILFLAVIKPF